jgi:hypothetical protein
MTNNPAARTNVFLQATPIEVGQILRECLWSKLEASVLTSATLAVGGGFEYIRGRLGLDHARELIVPSHFDYERQAILYVPPDLPDPRTPQFVGAATDRVRRLLEITRGRAFVLFTSYAQMNEIYDRLLGLLDLRAGRILTAQRQEILRALDRGGDFFQQFLQVFVAVDEVDLGSVHDQQVGLRVVKEKVFVGLHHFHQVILADGLFAGRVLFLQPLLQHFRRGLQIDDQVRRREVCSRK